MTKLFGSHPEIVATKEEITALSIENSALHKVVREQKGVIGKLRDQPGDLLATERERDRAVALLRRWQTWQDCCLDIEPHQRNCPNVDTDVFFKEIDD